MAMENSIYETNANERDVELVLNLAPANGLRSKWAGSRLREGGEGDMGQTGAVRRIKGPTELDLDFYQFLTGGRLNGY